MRRVGALLLAGGCTFSGPGVGGDGGGSDGPTDCVEWTRAGHVMACSVPAGPASTITSDATLDTTTGTYTMGAGPAGRTITGRGGEPLYVISVERFAVQNGATLRVVGSLPLLVLSWSDITIAGTIDVSSKRAGGVPDRGAGSGRSGCTPARDGDGQQDSGGGGGAGFGASGGAGGTGEGGNMGGMFGGSISPPVSVLAGCDGGKGGEPGDPTPTPTPGGAGGGAIHLTAKNAIVIEPSGRVHAGGMGGDGGIEERGGGGGGSGGFIGLDAPTVELNGNARVAANGGGGGVGCNGNGSIGQHGEDAQLGTTAAAGGAIASCANMNGNRGGAGGARTIGLGGLGTSSTNGGGGGGGGGGVGYILAWAVTLTVQIQGADSPAIQQRP